MDGWMNEQMNVWINKWNDGWMNEWTHEWMNEWINEWTMDEWTNEWMNKWMTFKILALLPKFLHLLSFSCLICMHFSYKFQFWKDKHPHRGKINALMTISWLLFVWNILSFMLIFLLSDMPGAGSHHLCHNIPYHHSSGNLWCPAQWDSG